MVFMARMNMFTRLNQEVNNNNNNNKQNDEENKGIRSHLEDEIAKRKDTPAAKKKTLSRVAIGGSNLQTGSELVGGGSSNIEFKTWKALLIFVVFGTGFTLLFRHEKKRLELQKTAEANRGMGKPLIGGPFDLIDIN
ncbi:hypothetical protein PACTADRAFT_1790 [Pachysolen tannophilus NRRL Y-2460]|uniref:Uncharacterized protein n=1 Tax=Pachysolen tannophilus NRRL Y-2460 TaxID=669874 RepID=A0A1E4TZP8_PACTA|nr:hypothetical protein PACTADRAFT_1790 [Pachysolen tannophilus NRRL Y-2460]